jgi:CheY-like chemotaxis protein
MGTSDLDILVLDDEAFIALDIEAVLRDAGYRRIRVCGSEAAALQAIEDRAPDLGLLDINLGRGTTSFEVARRLSAQGSGVAFMTGYTPSTVNVPEGLTDRPRLSKPFEDAQLRALVAGFSPR